MTKAKIYTRTGDQGSTRLVDGSCVEKFNPRVEAYGTIDELNSCLGIVRSLLTQKPEKDLDTIFFKIQNSLFIVGSLLATEKDDVFQKLESIEQKHIDFLEYEIDKLSSELPELKNFIIPAGHPICAYLHMARTICRRAERRSAEISVKDLRYKNCLIYLNRLSDYLFTAARWVQIKNNLPEVLWESQTK